jgi:hypothetical protein
VLVSFAASILYACGNDKPPMVPDPDTQDASAE